MGQTLAGLGSYGSVIYGGAYRGDTLYSINTFNRRAHTGRYGQYHLRRFRINDDGIIRVWYKLALYSIDPNTGAAIKIGQTSVPFNRMVGI